MAKRNLRTAIYAGAGALMLAAAGSAQAELSVSGIIDVWAGSQDTTDADSDSTLLLGGGGMSTSYIGVGLTEDLGNGLTAVGALQTFLRPDSAQAGRFNGDAFYARAANVGVSGSFGTVTGGRNTSPYFLPVVFTNAFADSFVFSPAIAHTFLGATQGDSGWSNSISYSMPSMGGVSANVVYAFGEQEDESGQGKLGGNVVFRGGGLTALVAGQQVDYDSTGGAADLPDTQTAVMLGASYDAGFLTVSGQYHNVSNDLDAGGDVDVDTFTGGVSVPAGPGNVLASYALSETETDTADTERNTYAVGYDYILSSRTDVYVNYFYDEVEDDDGQTYGVGVRHRF